MVISIRVPESGVCVHISGEDLCNLSLSAHCCFLGVLGFRGELGFLNCDDVCMCVVNKQFELLEFVSESVYVDLPYDEISFTFTAGFVWC